MSKSQLAKTLLALLAVMALTAAVILIGRSPKTREVPIGAGDLLVDIPSYLKVEQEEPDIVLAYVAGTNLANVRFTVIATGEGGAKKVDRPSGRKAYEIDDKRVEEWSKPTTREGEHATMTYWAVEYGHSLVVISCYISDSNRGDPTSLRVLASVPEIIHSLRRRGATGR